MRPPMAFGYARVSSNRQADGDSLAAQTSLIDQYRQMHLNKHEWGGIFRDDFGVSAYTLPFHKRRAAKEILTHVRHGDAIVVAKVDRLWRSIRDFSFMSEIFEALGVRIHVVDLMGVSLNADQPMGRFVLGMMVCLAQMESEHLGERIRIAAQVRRAKYPGIGFVRPLWNKTYSGQPRNQEYILKPDPFEWQLLKESLQMIREGRKVRHAMLHCRWEIKRRRPDRNYPFKCWFALANFPKCWLKEAYYLEQVEETMKLDKLKDWSDAILRTPLPRIKDNSVLHYVTDPKIRELFISRRPVDQYPKTFMNKTPIEKRLAELLAEILPQSKLVDDMDERTVTEDGHAEEFTGPDQAAAGSWGECTEFAGRDSCPAGRNGHIGGEGHVGSEIVGDGGGSNPD